METIVYLLQMALTVFYWIIILQIVISWLLAFDVINLRNPKAQNLIQLMNKITDPVYKPLRKFIPAIAGIDITPIIVIIGVILLRDNLLPRLLGVL